MIHVLLVIYTCHFRVKKLHCFLSSTGVYGEATNRRDGHNDHAHATTTATAMTTTTTRSLETVNTYVVSYRHGGAGNARGLGGEDHVRQDAVLIHDLLHHVTEGHLHRHRQRRTIVWHHPHSGGPWWGKSKVVRFRYNKQHWHPYQNMMDS